MYLLFTMPHCPQCTKVKSLLKEKGIKYTEYDVVKDPEGLKLARKYNVKMGGAIVDVKTGQHVDINNI